jgi:nucleoid-associated protein YgaU
MGLLKFFKESGDVVWGKGGVSESLAIEKHLRGVLGDQVNDLKVVYDKGNVTLSGVCDSQATKEKAILLAGNIKGVAAVSYDNLTTLAVQEEAEYYEIKKGDTLWKIAAKYYGDGKKYNQIFEANREVIKDANLIYPGQKIRIPKLS